MRLANKPKKKCVSVCYAVVLPNEPKSERVPLRDVQNELLILQDSPTLMLKHVSKHERDSKMKHEVVPDENPSLTTTTEVHNDDIGATDEHQHVILKSFVCLEGEVVVEDEPVKSDESVLISRLALGDNVPLQSDPNETAEAEGTENNQISQEHVDHPYYYVSRSTGSDASSILYQGEEVSTCELGNVTFKSLMCLGGEIQVSDFSAISDESILIKDLTSGNHSQCENTPVSEVDTEAVSVNPQPLGHSYCIWKNHVSLCEDSGTISTVNGDDASLSTFGDIGGTQCKTKNLNNHKNTELAEGYHDVSCRKEEITFKSLCCSGVEIEIADLSKVSEMSVLMENLAEEQSLLCLNDISENDGQSFAALAPESKHVDHLYYHTKEKSQVLNMSSAENEVSSKSQLSSASLLEKSGNTIGNTTSTTGNTEKMYESVTCHEVEASKMVASKESSQNLSALNCENKMESTDAVPLNDNDDDKLKVPKGYSSIMSEKNVEERLDRQFLPERNVAVSHSGEILCPQGASFENVAQTVSILKDKTLDFKDEEIHSEIEVMRLCDRSGEAASVHQDLPSALVLTGSCTPKTPTLRRSVLNDQTAENLLSHLWPELPESPMPPPLLNSTSLANALSYTPVPPDPPKKTVAEPKLASADHQKLFSAPPIVGNGPLQEQLRQMAELLMVASGKVVVPASAPVNYHNALVGTSPIAMQSACVWSTPVQMMERSVNTSEAMEFLKEVYVSDASTSTDSLLWNLTPGNLEHLSRSELEQRLTSTLIMVEVLSQQLTSARAHNPNKDTSPSDLRDKLIQTDHTELRQNGTYRDLYETALERIQSLEHDHEVLQTLHNSIQSMRVGMNSFKSSTEDAIFKMKRIGKTVSVDQETLSRQASQMKSLYGRYKETLHRMEQKMKDMKHRMDESLKEKEAAFSVTQQLRDYHTAQVAELEHTVGSHQELMSALKLAYPPLVELSKSYMESINAASVLLRRKHEDHMSLLAELRKAQELVQRINPVLHQLHQRTTTAVEHSEQHLAMRDRAIEERNLMENELEHVRSSLQDASQQISDLKMQQTIMTSVSLFLNAVSVNPQMENELEHVRSSLQDASQQISDLKMQQTIMTSEMSVLREQLNQAEEERFQLQRRSTELSATVTSTLASYAFLEQTLASETSNLEEALETSRKELEEYEDALSQRETLIKELHNEAEIYRRQLGQLAQLQTELSSAKEMSEFLQAEHELAREQMEESERLLRCHLQGLRERNLECEDLKLALEQLRLEKESLQEELDSTRDKARSMLLEQGEQMAQASNDVMLLNHRVSGLTSILKESLTSKESECSDKALQSHRHPSSSFVDSVMVAMMKMQEPETESPEVSEEREVQLDGIGSETSAFTRIPPTTHTVKEERRSHVLELLSDFGETISDLQLTIDQLRVQKDTEQQTLKQTIFGLQEALQEESQRCTLEVSELRQNVDRLQAQVEKDAVVLQQKAQDERNLRKLCNEMEENLEAAHKYRAENSELRREVADLRRLEQQAQVEAQVLREELNRTGVQSAASTNALDERIKLLREVEKLKANLMEAEENRAKVLERAKRHQRVHAMNQSKLERELHMLDDMIETVRKTLSSIPDLVKSCPELQKLVEFLG
ncbi:Sperm-associated antigen 5 [Anabarilius grahami]|uniref:Sperm-associated antigen 5 n=1 Tax=Anabarilius grahami TaxID=495550 RepID=A0A3N0Y982_ANAGA|nr:Sperm-associated antigen 5 [Anabarilius grahami]